MVHHVGYLLKKGSCFICHQALLSNVRKLVLESKMVNQTDESGSVAQQELNLKWGMCNNYEIQSFIAV